jgi:hypothetical protein
MTSVIGWIISGIFSIVVGMTFAMIIATLNKKVVRDQWGKIDFKKTDIYFYWTRWDTIMVISAVYTFLCITGLLVFLLRGDTIQSPYIQFFIHQSFVFGLITFIWLITKLAYVYKGIQKRWSDEFE